MPGIWDHHHHGVNVPDPSLRGEQAPTRFQIAVEFPLKLGAKGCRPAYKSGTAAGEPETGSEFHWFFGQQVAV